MVLLELLGNLDLDLIDILENYTEIDEYLYSYHGYDNETEVIEELILNDPIVTIKKQSCLINNVKKEEFIKDIFRPVRSY